MNTNPADKPIILASQSPRRSALLREAGIAFEAVSPRCEEPDMATWRGQPGAFAESASYLKVRSVSDDYADRVILGADTVVALDGRLYGKPADRNDARRILSALTGTTQEVITGVTLYQPASGQREIEQAVTRVTMRDMTDEEMDTYLDSGEWEGKAGAYGIQGTADAFVVKTEGSFTNVIGLPIELTIEMLERFGVCPKRR